MEFYKLRYNILKLFRETNIYSKNLFITINNFRKFTYVIIIIFLIIFVIGLNELNYLTIFFIIILISFYFISIDINDKINKIRIDKFYLNYKYNYELFNKFFIYSLNNIPNIEDIEIYKIEHNYIQQILLLYKQIKNVCSYHENLLKEDFNEYFSNLKINNDVLRYIDIYNQSYDNIKKGLLIKIAERENDKRLNELDDDYDMNSILSIDDLDSKITIRSIISDIKDINLTGGKYYYVDMELLNNNYKEFKNEYILRLYEYIKDKFEIKDGDLDYLKEPEFNIDYSIKEKINNFNYSFYQLIIFLILFMTIILHIMFYKFYSSI